MASIPTTTQWTQTSSNSFEAPLSTMERFFGAMEGPEGSPGHWIVTSAIKFSHPSPLSTTDLKAALRTAWMTMRQLEPGLDTAVDIRLDKKTFTVLHVETAEAWADETFHVHNGMTASQYFETITTSSKASLHYFPSSNELFFNTGHGHNVTDGRGCLHFWNQYFTLLSKPSPSISTSTNSQSGKDFEAGSLPPSIDHMLNLPSEGTAETKSLTGKLLAPYESKSSRIGMPIKQGATPSAQSSHTEVKMSHATTSKVITACKLREISVTTAWHAAVILAVRSIQAGKTNTTGNLFLSMTNIDLRQYLPTEHQAFHIAIACYLTALPFAFEFEGHDTTAHSQRECYDRITTNPKHFYANIFRNASVFPLHALSAYGEAILPDIRSGKIGGSAPMLSSIGVVDRFLANRFGQGWEIEDVWIADTLMSPDILAFLWTWQGRMVFSGSFNKGFYHEAEVRGLLERTKRVMLEMLDVEEVNEE